MGGLSRKKNTLISRCRIHAPLAAALWAAALFGGGVLAEPVHRVTLAGAITATLVYYIHRRATDRDVLVRLGLWTGAAVERQRCTMMHEPGAQHGNPTAATIPSPAGAVDSTACPATERDA